MFTDESKISKGSYTHDFIRLKRKAQEIKTGERDVYTLINRSEHTFKSLLIISGEISFY